LLVSLELQSAFVSRQTITSQIQSGTIGQASEFFSPAVPSYRQPVSAVRETSNGIYRTAVYDLRRMDYAFSRRPPRTGIPPACLIALDTAGAADKLQIMEVKLVRDIRFSA
jgi:hypothetical protein